MTQYQNETLNEREATHGDFNETARLAQGLKDMLRGSRGYQELSKLQREALDLICTKIARIMGGNPNTKDHWSDLAGYSNLISERLK